MSGKREEYVQQELCRYVSLKYPRVLFNSDLSGLTLSYGQANKVNKIRSCNGFPDFIMYYKKKDFVGLMLELKSEGTVIYKRDGKLRKDSHLQEQNRVHELLREQGWWVAFVIGLQDAIDLVDHYMNL